jgi:uncharacterized zinc-type alcohol dehydrogenase-like protein
MTMNVHGYAAPSVKADLVPYRFERRDPRADDVVIPILYCGVCHSDLHHVRDDWSNTTFPVAPGHEIIGRVINVGPDVTRFKPGDHVGVGCMVDSCQHCASCKQGLEQFCEEFPTLTFNSIYRKDKMPTFGGYSEKIIVSEKFVLRIPHNLELKSAGPLLCAGITTWSPLRHWKVGKGSNVGIVGLGGLGHMAIKLAKGLGANVTLFSRSPGKEQVASSNIGSITETQELIDFCGENGITADIELIHIQDINEAYKRMLKSDVKYRFVIDMASLKD